MPTRGLTIGAIAVVLAAGAAWTAHPQARPDVLVKQRKAAMTLQGKYFGPLVGMQRGTSPYDAAVAARNAKYLEALAAMPWDGFAEGTQNEESRALPAIWSEPAKFRASIDGFQAAVTALVAAADTGGEQDVKAAIETVGNACRGCHESFRSE